MARDSLDRPGSAGDARRLLQRRLEREEMGDEAHDRMIARHDDRPAKLLGVLFIAAFGAVVAVVVAFGW